MAWCPKCKNEYREGFTVCAECKVALVDSLEKVMIPLMFGKSEKLSYLKDFLEYNDWNAGLSPQEMENTIHFLMNHGMSRKEATDYCTRNIRISEFFQLHPEASYTFAKGTMISYGKK